jgi:NAD(P)-dependent dehydrogenase (short-subunit alcohol dehydrogenase family)
VVLAVRNRERGQSAVDKIRDRAPDAALEIADLDLSRMSSVAAFAEDQLGRGPVHILINNAGISLVPRRTLTDEGFELQTATNFLGHFVLTARLLPSLLAGADARIVSLSSITALAPRTIDPSLGERGRYNPPMVYAQSKLACAIFGIELDRRLKSAGRRAISVLAHPGWADTSLFAAHQDPLNRMLTHTGGVLASSADDGAACQVHAATAAELTGGEYIGPRWVARGEPWVIRPRRLMTDRATGRQLWQAAVDRTGVDFEF